MKLRLALTSVCRSCRPGGRVIAGRDRKLKALKSVIDWERRLADLKPTLMLYSVLHKFIHQEIEGDELYTKVDKNVAPSGSEGWTIVLMERGSRFLWELSCGRKDKQLFEQALTSLAKGVEQTGSISLLTDGERRYGNLLFEICDDVIRTGKPGRPKKRLPKGVRVRLKTRGLKSVEDVPVNSIKHRFLSTLRRSTRWPRTLFMRIMLKPSIHCSDGVMRPFVVKPIPMLNLENTDNEP